MPDDQNLEQQLAAYGQTLESATGEPITSGAEPSPAASGRIPRRWWAVGGAAAAGVIAVVGLIDLSGRGAEVSSPAIASDSVLAERIESIAVSAVPPLDLSGVDWHLERRSVGAYGVIDIMDCVEKKEFDALTGHEVITETYRSSEDSVVFAQVIHVTYGDPDEALRRVAPVTDPACGSGADLDWQQLEIDIGDVSIIAAGYVDRGGSARMTLVGADGRAIIAWLANSSDRALVDALTAEAVRSLDRPSPGLIDTQLLLSGEAISAVDGCLAGEEVVTDTVQTTGSTQAEAFAVATEVVAQGRPADGPAFVGTTWTTVFGPELSAFLDRGRGIEALARFDVDRVPTDVRPSGETVPEESRPEYVEVWHLVELAYCAPSGVAALPPVPPDPLGLEADGWRLDSRASDPFEFPVEDVPCDDAAVLSEFDGIDEIHDIVRSPDGRLDVDIQVLDVGSPDAGNRLADGMHAVGACIGELGGGAVEEGAMSSVRATWFRAGPDFAMATIVGDGGRSIILEIESAPFDDEVIADLIQRSAAYLDTGPSSAPAGDAMTTTMLPPLLPLEPTETALGIPNDPLGLEADGWVLAERTERAYVHDAELSDVECPEIDGRNEFDGASMVFDLIEAPDGPAGSRLDSMRVTVLELGDRGRAEEFATLIAESAQCWAEFLPSVSPGSYEVSVGGVPELGATWYRVGILIFVVVVGDDGTIVRLDPFGQDDDMLAISDAFLTDLAERAARFVEDR